VPPEPKLVSDRHPPQPHRRQARAP